MHEKSQTIWSCSNERTFNLHNYCLSFEHLLYMLISSLWTLLSSVLAFECPHYLFGYQLCMKGHSFHGSVLCQLYRGGKKDIYFRLICCSSWTSIHYVEIAKTKLNIPPLLFVWHSKYSLGDSVFGFRNGKCARYFEEHLVLVLSTCVWICICKSRNVLGQLLSQGDPVVETLCCVSFLWVSVRY